MIARVLSLIVAAAVAAPAACTVGTAACREKVPLGGNGRYSLVYRSFPLTAKNPRIERALIVVHGAGRNADSYFISGVAGALIADRLETSLVIAPRLASNQGGCTDALEPGEIPWNCGGDNDWRGGGAAHGVEGVYAFMLIDELIRQLNNRSLFPNLRSIVVSGHSAGGQFTNRYAALGQGEKTSAVPVKYVVMNPSSYLYLDATRLPPGATCSEKGGCSSPFREYREGRNCTTYNLWRYGLEKRTGYAASLPDADLKQQIASRDVTYLLGALDTLPLFGFDSSCPAMAQGPNRFARGINYWNYLRSGYKAEHKLVTVAACGHNGRCMYTADESLPVLFPK